MAENVSTAATAWLQQQQTPAGWFDLLALMIDGMVRNVGEVESQPFLHQMGRELADRWPLPESETLGELEENMNRFLTLYKWGLVVIHTDESGIRLHHQALPLGRDPESHTRWCTAFCTILEGVYSRWMQAQGGGEHMLVAREQLHSLTDVQFRYFNPS